MLSRIGRVDDTADVLGEKLQQLGKQALESPLDYPLDVLEDEVFPLVIEAGRSFIEAVSEARDGYQGTKLPSRTPGRPSLKFKDRIERTVLTTFGEVVYDRAYYRNSDTDESRWPRDEELGLAPREFLSPRLQERAAYLGTVTDSYLKAQEVLEKLLRINLEYKQVQRESVQIGEELEQEEQEQVKEVFETEDVPIAATGSEVLCIGTDGITTAHCAGGDMEIKVGRVEKVALQTRSPKRTARRRVKPRRGRRKRTGSGETRGKDLASSKTTAEDVEYQNASDVVGIAVAEVYPDRVHQPRYCRTTERSSFRATARLGPEMFGRALFLAALQLGLGLKTLVLFVADGSAWCWNLCETHFPGAVQILDVFHLARQVVRCANTLWRTSNSEAKRWRHRVMVQLLRGELDELLDELNKITFLEEAKREAVGQLVGYLEKNRNRMDYPRYVAKGYPLGSARIESACEQVIGSRMKNTGQRWDDDGADAMARLRALYCSGEWNKAFERRAQARRVLLRAA